MGRSKRKTPASAGGKKPARQLPAVTVVRQLQNKQLPPRAPAAKKLAQTANKPNIVFIRNFPPVHYRPIRNLALLPMRVSARVAKERVKMLKSDEEETPRWNAANSSIIKLSSLNPLGDRMTNSSYPSRPLHISGGPANTGLAACAVWYAKALTNPFGQFEELPCIPSSPAVPSYRYRALSRGSFVTSGTTGVGFVMIAPYVPCNNVSNAIFYSSLTTYAGSAFANTGTGVGTAFKPLPYQSTSFSGTTVIQGKLVGAGLRVRNITQALNVGGILYGVTIPSDGSLQGLSQSQVTSYPGTLLVPQVLAPANEWSVVILRPSDVTDLDYNDAGVINFSACMGFMAMAPGP